LWINDQVAKQLGIKMETLLRFHQMTTLTIRAKVTPFIHPEAVFMYRGLKMKCPLKLVLLGKESMREDSSKVLLKRWLMEVIRVFFSRIL